MVRWPREDPVVPVPQAIVVSGDLVRGVRLGESNVDAQLDAQYNDAMDFLVRLTDQVLGGDRGKVVLVPGNHDVDWNCARSAMELVDDAMIPLDLKATSFGPDSNLRWDWRERRVYQIVDRPKYEQRFDRFAQLFNDFYGPSATYNPTQYFHAFELQGGRIGVAGFNSAFGNDCFAFHGAIPEEAVAAAHMELADRGYDLLIGVWHHNVEGAPYSSDYMDIDTIYRLISKGFRLGLHGHQHRAQTGQRSVRLPEQEPIALIGAGSLCAGSRELPPGVNRQYNVVVLADDYSSVRVHIREVAVSTIFAAARRPEFGGNSYVDIEMPKPDQTGAASIRDTAVLLRAEEALHAERYREVVSLLTPVIRPPDSFADGLLVEALRKGRLWNDVDTALAVPASQGHLALRVEAAIESGSPDAADLILDQYANAVGLSTAIERDLRNRIAASRTMRS